MPLRRVGSRVGYTLFAIQVQFEKAFVSASIRAQVECWFIMVRYKLFPFLPTCRFFSSHRWWHTTIETSVYHNPPCWWFASEVQIRGCYFYVITIGSLYCSYREMMLTIGPCYWSNSWNQSLNPMDWSLMTYFLVAYVTHCFCSLILYYIDGLCKIFSLIRFCASF